MGNDTSKEIREIADVLEDGNVCSTPHNQFSWRNNSGDPRSPTEGILRTPIEFRKEVLGLNVDTHLLRRRWKSEPAVSPYSQEKCMKSNFHLLMSDPRSPTYGIIRTPIQVLCKKYDACDSKQDKCENHNELVENVDSSGANIVEDCRSPSLGISRTPIQVSTVQENSGEIYTPDCVGKDVCDEKVTSASVKTWLTPLSTKFCAPEHFVYTDDENVNTQSKTNVKILEPDGSHEKENDVNLKRKLVFTPENKMGIKVRTPLGSRCNFQDSPSQYLKIMQVQKLSQDVVLSGDILPNSTRQTLKSTQRKSSIIDWDKDSSIVM